MQRHRGFATSLISSPDPKTATEQHGSTAFKISNAVLQPQIEAEKIGLGHHAQEVSCVAVDHRQAFPDEIAGHFDCLQ